MVQTLQGDNLEERVAFFRELQKTAGSTFNEEYHNMLTMSWIYHDSALEGVVYTMDELRTAMFEEGVGDATLVPVYDEIRHHLGALDMIRGMAQKKRFSITIDTIKKLFAQLAPEELDGKPPIYRKDMPLHRLYFHEVCEPDKISYRMRQLAQWINAAETKRATHPVRLAARAHYQLLQIYPFAKHSGKVARLVMNLVLLHHGYPPVIVHAAERQTYYEAIKQSEENTAVLVNNAIAASIESAIRHYEDSGIRVKS